MTTFAELQAERGLQRYIGSDAGTLFFDPAQGVSGRTLVRHFDAAIPPELTAAYGELMRSTASWVGNSVDLSPIARVERPVAVGEDYLERPHGMYEISTDDYSDPRDPVEPPDDYRLLLAATRAALDDANRRPSARGEVVARVVERTFLEPNGRTYFDQAEDRFVAVEPMIAPEDVRAWAAISAASR